MRRLLIAGIFALGLAGSMAGLPLIEGRLVAAPIGDGIGPERPNPEGPTTVPTLVAPNTTVTTIALPTALPTSLATAITATGEPTAASTSGDAAGAVTSDGDDGEPTYNEVYSALVDAIGNDELVENLPLVVKHRAIEAGN